MLGKLSSKPTKISLVVILTLFMAPFQNLFSVAKHGLKKAGDKAGDTII